MSIAPLQQGHSTTRPAGHQPATSPPGQPNLVMLPPHIDPNLTQQQNPVQVSWAANLPSLLLVATVSPPEARRLDGPCRHGEGAAAPPPAAATDER
jgi:hypothetical protein